MAKPKNDWEKMLVRFPLGTEKRLVAVLAAGEDRTGVIRDALETELRRREKAAKKAKADGE